MNHATARSTLSQHSQRGAALIVAMVMLLVMTLLGVTAVRNTTLQERMAGNLRDNNLAFQAAEAALREGEQFLESPTIPPFTGANGLLPMEDDAGRVAFWNSYDWTTNGRPAAGVAHVAAPPLYVIDEMPPLMEEPGGSAKFSQLPNAGFYRITARAVGDSTDAVTILQTTYRR